MEQVLEFVRNLLATVWSFDGVKFICGHVVLNLIVAVAAALKTKTFNLSKVADFFAAKLMPYVIVYFGAKMLGDQIGLDALAPLAWGVITATLLGDLMDSLAQLGLKLPESIRRFVVKGLNPNG